MGQEQSTSRDSSPEALLSRIDKMTRMYIVEDGEARRERKRNGNGNGGSGNTIGRSGSRALVRAEDAKTDNFKGELQVLEARDIEHLDPKLRQVVDTVTVYRRTLPVGSFKYNIFQYPGDVDIFEQVQGCCTRERAAEDLARRLRDVVRRVELSKEMYFAEFKAGLDERYQPFGPDTLVNVDADQRGWEGARALYDADRLRRALVKLEDNGLLTKKQTDELDELIHDNPTEKQYKALYDVWRNYWIVRWTADDIEALQKELPKGRTMTLAEAMTHPTTAKMDAWAFVGNRWIEVTNFFDLTVVDEDGNVLEHYSPPLGDYRANLLRDVRKYACKNAMKAAKRFFIERVAAYRESPNETTRQQLETLAPLFSSNIAHISQMAADAETLSLMAESLGETLPRRSTTANVLNMGKILHDVLHAEGEQKKARDVEKHVNTVYRAYKGQTHYSEALKTSMDAVHAILMPIIHEKSAVFLERTGVTQPQCKQ